MIIVANTVVKTAESITKENYIDLIGFILNNKADKEDARDIFNYAQYVSQKKSAHKPYEPKG